MPTPAQLAAITARPSLRSAASFASASSQYLSIASNSTLQAGDVDHWLAAWVYLSATTAGRGLAGKYASEYVLYEETGKLQYYIGAYIGATGAGTVNVGTGGWHFAFCWHDSVNDTVNISVDGAAAETAAKSGGQAADASAFSLGGPFGGYSSCRLASVAFGKSPPGGIASLATTIRNRLYNGGRHLDLRRIPYGEWSSWGGVSAWPLTEGTGTRYDVWGNNHLTDNNGVTVAPGPA